MIYLQFEMGGKKYQGYKHPLNSNNARRAWLCFITSRMGWGISSTKSRREQPTNEANNHSLCT